MVTTEIAIFDKEEFEPSTIEFFLRAVQKEKIIETSGLNKKYAMFEMQDMNYLVQHPSIQMDMRQKLVEMLNKVNYVPKQHSQQITKYFFCIFF